MYLTINVNDAEKELILADGLVLDSGEFHRQNDEPIHPWQLEFQGWQLRNFISDLRELVRLHVDEKKQTLCFDLANRCAGELNSVLEDR